MPLQGPILSSAHFKISETARDFLEGKVNGFRRDLSCRNPEQSKKIRRIFNRTFSDSARLFDTAKTAKAFAELTQQRIASLQIALDEIGLSGGVDFPQLKHFFDICEKIAEKDSEIQDELLTPYIDEPWLEEFLDWALEKNSLLLENFFLKNEDHPLIRRVIEKGLEKDSHSDLKKRKNMASDLLVFISGESESAWARNVLIESLEKSEDSILLDRLRGSVQLTPKKFIWLHETLFKWLENDQPYACELLLDFFHDDQNPEVEKMITDFMTKKCDGGNHKWQLMTIVLASMNERIIQKISAIGESRDIEKIKQSDLQSQIWCQNFASWTKNLSAKLMLYRKRFFTISESQCFQVCLKSLESLFQMHLFIMGSSDYERLGRNGTCFFPKAKGILFGEDSEFQPLINDVANFLSKEAIKVTPYQCVGKHTKIEGDVKILPRTFNSLWVRDDVQLGYSDDGKMSYKISNFIFDEGIVFPYYHRNQKLRYGNKEYDFGEMGISLENFSMLGMSNLYYKLPKKEDRKLETLWTYGEGGNFRFGIDKEGGRYCLLGKDTFELNRAILSQEIKSGNYSQSAEGFKFEGFQLDVDETRECVVSDELLFKFFERDYGKGIEFIPIEQPHAFHIDMKLAIVGPKKVILNDSVRSLEVALEYFEPELPMTEEKWAEHVEKLKAIAAHEKILEDKCEADLIQASFEVVRVPGDIKNIYRKAPELEQANIFNHITLETSDDSPRHILIALGCGPKFQELFNTIMKDHCDYKDLEILYVDKEISQKALEKYGGMNCLTVVLEQEI